MPISPSPTFSHTSTLITKPASPPFGPKASSSAPLPPLFSSPKSSMSLPLSSSRYRTAKPSSSAIFGFVIP
ncbi:hypothetical protein FCV25MIE_04206 [Fagus crenata]